MMKMKPPGWEFVDKDFCCSEFRSSTFVDYPESADIRIDKEGTSVTYMNKKIKYCPFCGKKIELQEVRS